MSLPQFKPRGNGRPRVLVAAEPSVATRSLIDWLRAWGYQVDFVDDGMKAWDALQQSRPPELVIVDGNMPKMDGAKMCRRLRTGPRDYYHYILMMTGQNGTQEVVRALEAGADDCLTSPLEKAEVRARITAANRIIALQEKLITAREGLRYQAAKDGLTGQWNRVAFLELFQRELDRASRSNGSTGLLLLDLDHFKSVNDTYGHLVGDVVLKVTAQRLRKSVRSFDSVGRYGGDEFFIALPNCDGSQISRRAERIRLALASQPIRIGDAEIRVTVSIGAVTAAAPERTISDVLAAADAALYKAKGAGRNCTAYRGESARNLKPPAIDNLAVEHAALLAMVPTVARQDNAAFTQ